MQQLDQVSTCQLATRFPDFVGLRSWSMHKPSFFLITHPTLSRPCCNFPPTRSARFSTSSRSSLCSSSSLPMSMPCCLRLPTVLKTSSRASSCSCIISTCFCCSNAPKSSLSSGGGESSPNVSGGGNAKPFCAGLFPFVVLLSSFLISSTSFPTSSTSLRLRPTSSISMPYRNESRSTARTLSTRSWRSELRSWTVVSSSLRACVSSGEVADDARERMRI